MATTNSQAIVSAVPPYTALRIEILTSGLRQYTIADRVGIDDGHLSKILSGRKPLTEDLEKKIRAAIAQGSAA